MSLCVPGEAPGSRTHEAVAQPTGLIRAPDVLQSRLQVPCLDPNHKATGTPGTSPETKLRVSFRGHYTCVTTVDSGLTPGVPGAKGTRQSCSTSRAAGPGETLRLPELLRRPPANQLGAQTQSG